MLIQPKNDHNKIVMGLLSLSSQIESTDQIQEALDWFDASDQRQIYLWKDEESQDIIGLLGIEIEDALVIVRYLTISPSFRNEGVSSAMLDALAKEYPDYQITGTLITNDPIIQWQKQRKTDEED